MNVHQKRILAGLLAAMPLRDNVSPFPEYYSQWLATINALEKSTGFALREQCEAEYNRQPQPRL